MTSGPALGAPSGRVRETAARNSESTWAKAQATCRKSLRARRMTSLVVVFSALARACSASRSSGSSRTGTTSAGPDPASPSLQRSVQSEQSEKSNCRRPRRLTSHAHRRRRPKLRAKQGRPGGRFMNNMDKPSMLLEPPDTKFRPHWDEMLLARMTKVISGLRIPRRKARPKVPR